MLVFCSCPYNIECMNASNVSFINPVIKLYLMEINVQTSPFRIQWKINNIKIIIAKTKNTKCDTVKVSVSKDDAEINM